MSSPANAQRSRVRLAAASVLAGGGAAVVIPLVFAAVVLLYPTISGNNQYWIREISLIAVLTLVVSGVNLSFGYAGELQFGQVFMYALGAYIGGILSMHGHKDIVVLMVISGLAALAVGVVIAVPALRIGGWSLAMASFFLIITIPDFVALYPKWTGGLNGLIGIPAPRFAGHNLSPTGLFYATVIPTIVWLACYRNLVTSRYGTVFRILRESPILASSLAFSPRRLKVFAYGAGALPAGVAGCLSGFLNYVVDPSAFGLSVAVGIVAASILGGIESVYGAVVGAAILQLGPEKSLSFATYSPVVYGLFLVFAAVLFRGGLGGLGLSLALRLNKLTAGAAAAEVAGHGSLSAHAGGEDVPPDARSVEFEVESKAALAVHGVSKSFGGVAALTDVSLTAEPGVITGLIGSNGSGKTTLLNIICGYLRPDGGSVQFADADLSRLPSYKIARAGVGRTFQTPSVPRGVSVLDVVASGRFAHDHTGVVASVLRLPRYWRARRRDRVRALALLDLIGLAHLADNEASSLSLGNRRLVEVARALAGEPRLLLLDEPASGLSSEEAELLGSIVERAAAAGVAVVLIEHNFRFVASIADVIHVLHLGRNLASGTAAEIAANPEVVESYLGRTDEAGEPEADAATLDWEESSTLLEVKEVVTGYGDLRVLQGIDLVLKPGNVELIVGRNGVGKTTLLSAIAGQLPLWSGSIVYDGKAIGRRAAYRRAGSGIALVQEGKRIFRHRTVFENVVLGTYSLRLGRAERRALVESVIENFPILVEFRGRRAGGLSGGQQQMLALAQALASRPRVLLLDEPSAGLAPTITAEVFARIRSLADDGLAVLLVEQLADRALPIADHVTVMDEGRVVASGPPADFHDLRELQEAYFGGS